MTRKTYKQADKAAETHGPIFWITSDQAKFLAHLAGRRVRGVSQLESKTFTSFQRRDLIKPSASTAEFRPSERDYRLTPKGRKTYQLLLMLNLIPQKRTKK